MKALCFDVFGGPEVLSLRDVPDPAPTAHHAIVRCHAIGLNFADVYRRRGAYHLEGVPPFILGYEGAGEILSVESGSSVRSAFQVGQRVGFADCPHANAEQVSVPLDKLIPLPDDISFETAAASLLQGMTAQYLSRDSHRLHAGESMLVHAAAGGVGSLLVQVGKMLGARVLGLTSSEQKASHVRELGADEVALYSADWVARAKVFSGGRGVDVVYDSVGSTLMDSFSAARTGGHVVFYGMAGGDPKSVDPRMLMDTSKSLTGGDLWNVLTSAEERVHRAHEMFGWIRSGQLRIQISGRFALGDGASAHRLLESRTSTGKLLLLPEPIGAEGQKMSGLGADTLR